MYFNIWMKHMDNICATRLYAVWSNNDGQRGNQSVSEALQNYHTYRNLTKNPKYGQMSLDPIMNRICNPL